MAKMANLTIDGCKVSVEEGTTILKAAEKVGINIPTLCYHPDLEATGACGVCVVKVEGMPALKRACCTPVGNGWIVRTQTAEVRDARKLVVELLLSSHPADCLICRKNGNCELQKLAEDLGLRETRFGRIEKDLPQDTSSPSIVRDPNKCILCGRCVEVCQQVQTVVAIDFTKRGIDTVIGLPFERGLGDSVCTNCGQCINYCPVGAIYESEQLSGVWKALSDPEKYVVVQEAPAIRVSLGEEFGMAPGEVVSGKMHAVLRRLGFDAVFDTNFAADLTIMEEASELLERVKKGGPFPMFTSCCPAWIKFMETFYPDLIENVSSCKSPQQMFGAMAKTYYARKTGIDSSKITSVSVMPCTAKKFEAQRPEMRDSGYPDVDYVLTTRELAQMIKESGIDFKSLLEEKANPILGEYTGAGTIFGATGGVMEAALRTGYEFATGKTLEEVDFIMVRGMEGIKEAEIEINGTKIKVAVAHGLGNARQVLDKVREQKEKGIAEYHFIEIMACPGGCVGGGGQPYGSDMKTREERGKGLYEEDKVLTYRKSHENPYIKKLYEDYLEKPLSEKAHHLLHTQYAKREVY